MEDITLTEEMITIIWDDHEGVRQCKVINQDEHDEPVTLEEIRLSICEEHIGSILVIAESFLNGTIYRYGNHDESWEKVGTMEGFA